MNDPQTYEIIGAAIEVHKELGSGFLEVVYQEALELEFKNRNIEYSREHGIRVSYKGTELNSSYRVDFLCFGSVLVELKALTSLTSTEESQVLNYLKASGQSRAILLNFGTKQLQVKRMILSSSYLSVLSA
jgi:GxxExxY protein